MSLLEISIRIGNIITSFNNVLQGGSFHQWLFIQNSAASMQMVLMQPLSLLHFSILFFGVVTWPTQTIRHTKSSLGFLVLSYSSTSNNIKVSLGYREMCHARKRWINLFIKQIWNHEQRMSDLSVNKKKWLITVAKLKHLPLHNELEKLNTRIFSKWSQII